MDIPAAGSALHVEAAVRCPQRRTVEHQRHRDVHVALIVFELEEQGVERRQPLIVSHVRRLHQAPEGVNGCSPVAAPLKPSIGRRRRAR